MQSSASSAWSHHTSQSPASPKATVVEIKVLLVHGNPIRTRRALISAILQTNVLAKRLPSHIVNSTWAALLLWRGLGLGRIITPPTKVTIPALSLGLKKKIPNCISCYQTIKCSQVAYQEPTQILWTKGDRENALSNISLGQRGFCCSQSQRIKCVGQSLLPNTRKKTFITQPCRVSPFFFFFNEVITNWNSGAKASLSSPGNLHYAHRLAQDCSNSALSYR